MPQSMDSKVVHSDPEITLGTPMFAWIRGPVRNLWDHLEGGHVREVFIKGFRREKKALRVIERARRMDFAKPAAETDPALDADP